jgi:hypothetical protein
MREKENGSPLSSSSSPSTHYHYHQHHHSEKRKKTGRSFLLASSLVTYTKEEEKKGEK